MFSILSRSPSSHVHGFCIWYLSHFVGVSALGAWIHKLKSRLKFHLHKVSDRDKTIFGTLFFIIQESAVQVWKYLTPIRVMVQRIVLPLTRETADVGTYRELLSGFINRRMVPTPIANTADVALAILQSEIWRVCTKYCLPITYLDWDYPNK
jgi:hypothetical protein